MVASSEFTMVTGRGWQRGFGNLFRKENRAWWGTRRWLFQAILWCVLVNGYLAFTLFALAPMLAAVGGASVGDPVMLGLQAVFELGSTLLAAGIILIAHDEIFGERQNGATEWILSKPASRPAYILSKLAADAIGAVVILVGLQMAIAYGLFWLANGGPLPLGPYMVAVAALALHTLFYLGLTILMGTFATGRGMLLGVPLGVLFIGFLLYKYVGRGVLALYTPWALGAIPAPYVSGAALPVPIWAPMLVTAVLTGLCIALALWKFRRLEF